MLLHKNIFIPISIAFQKAKTNSRLSKALNLCLCNIAGAWNAFKKKAAILALTAIAAVTLSDKVKAETLGYVYKQFSLNASGLDTGAGNDPNENYFHTSAEIQQRDSNGNMLKIIPLPTDIYGIASDGNNLFASSVSGSTIYRYLGDTQGWSGGLGIAELSARGLAVTPNYFGLIVDDGVNLAIINRNNGQTVHKIDISSFTGMDGGMGLDYIPITNEFAITDGFDKIYLARLSQDFSSIESVRTIQTSGFPAYALYGIGFNTSTCKFVLNQATDTGQYAYGPNLEVIIDSNLVEASNPMQTDATYTLQNNSTGINVSNASIPSAGVTTYSVDIANRPNWKVTYCSNNLVVEPNLPGVQLQPGQSITIYAHSQYPTVIDASAQVTTTGGQTNVPVTAIVQKTLSGDIDDDGIVNMTDVLLIINRWLSNDPNIREDINGDGTVNLRDYAVPAGQYLQTEEWYQP